MVTLLVLSILFLVPIKWAAVWYRLRRPYEAWLVLVGRAN
jgi:hypothetical protein